MVLSVIDVLLPAIYDGGGAVAEWAVAYRCIHMVCVIGREQILAKTHYAAMAQRRIILRVPGWIG